MAGSRGETKVLARVYYYPKSESEAADPESHSQEREITRTQEKKVHRKPNHEPSQSDKSLTILKKQL